MTLTFVIPALLWPRQVMRDTLFDTDFPALQTLLGKSRQLVSKTRSAESWWSAYFGISLEELAAAPLRLAALGEDPGSARWLCADPVHLRIDKKGASLTDPALLNISASEARQLHAALAPLFAMVGELILTTPSNWHLRLPTSASAPLGLPAHLNDSIESSATALLPPGNEGREWRRLINEAQMLLHAHALNEERSDQGRTTINSIALWGEGYAPTLLPQKTAVLLSDDLIIAGAGKLAAMETSALPPRFTTQPNDCVVYADSLRFPAARHDALAWRDGLQQLEQEWLAPALQALEEGHLTRIELHGFGDERVISTAMTSFDRFRFWRKPRRLESL